MPMTLRPVTPARLLPLALLAFCALVGCAEGPVKPDPALVAELRDRYLLEAEPAGALTPLDWREAKTGDAAEPESTSAEPGGVVLVGQVGGMPSPWGDGAEPHFPWREGEATFFLVDPTTAAEFSDHADEAGEAHAADCAFCANKAADKSSSVAVVTFSGGEGQPAAPIDSRDLFGLKVGDLVVVRGVASLKGGVLLVAADGLHRRP